MSDNNNSERPNLIQLIIKIIGDWATLCRAIILIAFLFTLWCFCVFYLGVTVDFGFIGKLLQFAKKPF